MRKQKVEVNVRVCQQKVFFLSNRPKKYIIFLSSTSIGCQCVKHQRKGQLHLGGEELDEGERDYSW